MSDTLRGWPHLYRRLGLILEQLAAHGRTAIVKGCARPNRGWRRSPLGGANGNQYYLWWGIAGSRGPADSCGAGPGTIVVRDVRHHGDHRPLGAGRGRDYLPIAQATEIDGDIAGRPRNSRQAAFETDPSPVRVLRGRPGSGKTTALWRAIEARSDESVLYVTWSARLRRSAEERLGAFAPAASRIRATDFRTLTGEITGEDVRRMPPAESRARLAEAIQSAVGHERHPWKGHEGAVYAEVRGRLLGRGVDGEADSEAGGKLAALRPETYRRQRGHEQGIGGATAKTLLRVWEKVPETTRVGIFPELAAAAAAARLLPTNGLPPGMEFDRLVVDEAQDLTLTEFWMLLELLRACRRRTGKSPWLLVAGDAGQRVRVGALHRASQQPLAQAGHLRPGGPRALSGADRGGRQPVEHLLRPGRQEPPAREAAAPGRDRARHRNRHRGARRREGTGPRPRRAARRTGRDGGDHRSTGPARMGLDERRRKLVLTPAEAKGLEYQQVCVLDAGAAIESFNGSQDDERTALRQESRRDRDRPAARGAEPGHETLAVVNVEPTTEAGRWNRLLLARLDEARGARRGQGAYGRGAGGLRTARDAGRHQPRPAQGCAMGAGGGARRRERGPEVAAEGRGKSRARGPADSTRGCTSKNAGASTRRSSGCGTATKAKDKGPGQGRPRESPGSTTPGSPRGTDPPQASARSRSRKQPSDVGRARAQPWRKDFAPLPQTTRCCGRPRSSVACSRSTPAGNLLRHATRGVISRRVASISLR